MSEPSEEVKLLYALGLVLYCRTCPSVDRGFHEVYLLWQEFFFRLSLAIRDCLTSYNLVNIHLVLHERALSSLVLNEFVHWHRKVQAVSRASQHVIGIVWLSQTFVNCSFHYTFEGTDLKYLGSWSINGHMDYCHCIVVRSSFCHLSCIAKQSHYCVRHWDQDTCGLIENRILELR